MSIWSSVPAKNPNAFRGRFNEGEWYFYLDVATAYGDAVRLTLEEHSGEKYGNGIHKPDQEFEAEMPIEEIVELRDRLNMAIAYSKGLLR